MPLPTGFKIEEQSTQPAMSLPAGFQIEPESFNAFKMIMNAQPVCGKTQLVV